MKSLLLITSICISSSVTVFAQSYESSIEYGKKKQQAIAIDYAYTQEAVENAIVQKIEKMGFKAKEEKGMFNKDKGFIVFKNALIPEISDSRMDYIVKTDRKSRREKDETTLYIIMQKDGENALSSMDAYSVGKAKGFVNGLTPEIEEASLELQIKAQDNEVVKAEKKFKDLQDEKADLEKKLKKNTEDIEKQQKYIETQRSALDGLKSKRRTEI
ncbi:hypothetical protein [Terrimonas alba]|uniref:hypothetical protein n=1 Tax=Terrimonas alba TaxID=3349636 RepID=UPI0035F338A6